MTDGFQVDPGSLTGVASTLHDLARHLHTGQVDLFVLDWANAPASHPEIAQAMRSFVEFAHDQHQDVVALLAALSTRVKTTADNYQHTDGAIAADITTLLTQSTYQSAEQRTA
ncbi:type VII secretion target [Micromonospora sp. NPDC049679]|uniref:type VII secretion target n=1 Tax=Micromonospora sp. NPDC049679 TaxID=3155920 RepID=UPI0033DF7E5B